MLIVEDQEAMRRSLREFLQSAFPEKKILEAADGATALRLCREHPPSVVLMDIGLPDANGIELTAHIKAMLPDTRVIVVSAFTGKAYADHARAAGAFAYIEKSTVYEALLPALQAALSPHSGSAGNNPIGT